MRSETIDKCFNDILQAISLVEAWVLKAGGSKPALLGDPMVRSAIERQLLIVSEAAVRLHKLDPQVAQSHAPTQDWRGIRAIGNFIRHEYDDIDTAILIDVIDGRLEGPASPRWTA